jgi:hypothetical protein
MKKTLVASILGLTAVVCNTQGQGQIQLYSYYQPSAYITYGANSGGVLNDPVSASSGMTVGFYYATAASFSESTINAAMAGDGGNGLIPSLTLFTGAQGTALLGDVGGDFPGRFGNTEFLPTLPTVGSYTFVFVAYSGSDYASSLIRGHSAAFTMPTKTAPDALPVVGEYLPGFSVYGPVAPIPEPSTFALAGLGLASLLIFRRRK